MRSIVVGTALALGAVAAPRAQVSFAITTPNVSIGINVPSYPTMSVIPGYPVYYAPYVDANYFFYDGLYWVYANDNWYSSYWYNGPWTVVAPTYVPVYVLRVPVRYYRVAPVYFRPWRPDAPPHWGQRWGRDWEQRRSGWDRWDRNAAPHAAPLPTYQRHYAGERYPRGPQQGALHDQNYRYAPRDRLARAQYERERIQRAPAPQIRRAPPEQQRVTAAPQRDVPMPKVTDTRVTGTRPDGPPREATRFEHDRNDARHEPPGQARREASAPQLRSVAPQYQAQRAAPPPPQVQVRAAPPQQPPQVQVRAEPPRSDGRGGGRPQTAGHSADPGGHGKVAHLNGKSGGHDRAKGGNDQGKK
jgi:hypothetical protein